MIEVFKGKSREVKHKSNTEIAEEIIKKQQNKNDNVVTIQNATPEVVAKIIAESSGAVKPKVAFPDNKVIKKPYEHNKKRNKDKAKYYKIIVEKDTVLIASECKPETLLNKWLEFVKNGTFHLYTAKYGVLKFIEYLQEHGIRACLIETTAILDADNEIIKEIW